MKYSKNFERDYDWYLKYRHQFDFDGSNSTSDKVIYSEDGKTAKECFYVFDCNGIVIPTVEPELLYQIHKAKGSVNFNIKMWAESRGKFEMGRIEFDEIAKELELLPWMIAAVENQKFKYYP